MPPAEEEQKEGNLVVIRIALGPLVGGAFQDNSLGVGASSWSCLSMRGVHQKGVSQGGILQEFARIRERRGAIKILGEVKDGPEKNDLLGGVGVLFLGVPHKKKHLSSVNLAGKGPHFMAGKIRTYQEEDAQCFRCDRGFLFNGQHSN